MSKLVVWGIEPSPPTRGIRMLLKHLDLDYEFKRVNILEGEHYTNELVKHNPKPTVPCLQDGELFFFESHSIAAYVMDKYAKSDELYPKDLVKRAKVERLLFIDAGMLFPALYNIVGPFVTKQKVLVEEEKLENITEAYETLETLLQAEYFVGDHLTIADILCFSTIKSLDVFLTLDGEKFPKLDAWVKRMESMSDLNEINEEGLKFYRTLIKPKLTYIWH